MTGQMYGVVLRADQALQLGVGAGSGFTGRTETHLPSSTLRGALAAALWREKPEMDQAAFNERIGNVAFGDAVLAETAGDAFARWLGIGVALDRKRCKLCEFEYAEPADWLIGSAAGRTLTMALLGYPATSTKCSHNHEALGPSKGQRPASSALSTVRQATRVALDSRERAVDEMLFERESLLLADSARMVALAVGDVPWLATPGLVIRVGAGRSVMGRMTVESLHELQPETVTIPRGSCLVRIELLTDAVFVDEFGRPADHPTSVDLAFALGLPVDATCRVAKSYMRWTRASGWHTKASAPKPEDAASLAHSVYLVELDSPQQVVVPAVGHTLGVRLSEGCGWFHVSLQPAANEGNRR